MWSCCSWFLPVLPATSLLVLHVSYSAAMLWSCLQVLPEKEARAITSQIFAGLAYLNEPGRRFIHYDLKWGRLLSVLAQGGTDALMLPHMGCPLCMTG